MKRRVSVLSAIFVSIFFGFISLPIIFAANNDDGFIISEYVEWSSYNKAIELYNGSDSTIDLSNYKIETYYNWNKSAGDTLILNGTLGVGKTYVIVHSSANANFINKANLINWSVTKFNGDDAIALVRLDDSFVDVFGQIWVQPNKAWNSGWVSTLDKTLVRKSNIVVGRSNGDEEFDPSLEWIQFPIDTFEHLWNHEMDKIDTTKPIATINLADGQDEITDTLIVKFLVNFSEEIQSFTCNETILNGTAPWKNCVDIENIANNDFEITIEAEDDWTIILELPDWVIEDLAGNTNDESVYIKNIITIDRTVDVDNDAWTILNPGDIAFITVNANPDFFEFVVLKDIEAGTVIYFSDNAWNANDTRRSGEGFLKFEASSSISAGTKTYVCCSDNNNPVVDFEVWTIERFWNFDLTVAGETILAYQWDNYDTNNPNFIAGHWFKSAWIIHGAPGTNNSYLPSTLIIGLNVLDYKTGHRNTQYNGVNTDLDDPNLLSDINNPSNRVGNNHTDGQFDAATYVFSHSSNWWDDNNDDEDINLSNGYFNGLVLYLPLDEDTKDHSGNGNHPNNHGAISTEWKINGAYNFAGEKYLNITPTETLKTSTMLGDFTVSFRWAFADKNSDKMIISQSIGAGDNPKWMIGTQNWGKDLLLNYRSDTHREQKIAPYTFVVHDDLQHYIIRKEGNQVKIYKNWIIVSNGTVSPFTLSNLNIPIDIWRGEWQSYYNNVLDELAVWNRALSSEEIAWLYNNGEWISLLNITNTHTLTYTAWENGSLSGELVQSVEEWNDGSAVEATADEWYKFSERSDGSTENPRMDTNISGNVDVTAIFVADNEWGDIWWDDWNNNWWDDNKDNKTSWGGGYYLTKDYCPGWDFSPSYYDWTCEEQMHGSASNKKEKIIFYPTITRWELWQMVWKFTNDILKLKTKDYLDCSFEDINHISEEWQKYIKYACIYKIMWVSSNGESAKQYFEPDNLVSYNEFVVVVSRLLFGNKYNDIQNWYQKHVEKIESMNLIEQWSRITLETIANVFATIYKNLDWIKR